MNPDAMSDALAALEVSEVLPAPLLVKRPAWTLWCELVSREARGQGSVEDSLTVRRPENLLAWLRALNAIKADVDAFSADTKLHLRDTAPRSGEQPSEEYLLAKREYDRRHAGRIRVARSVTARLDECRHLIDQHDVNKVTLGFLVEKVCRAEELLCRDDVDGALGVLRNALHKALEEGL